MRVLRLLKISRPRFWIYELGPYALGVAAAAGGDFSVWLLLPALIFFVFFTYPANIYIYGINDIYDYETDKHNPKKVQYESLVLPHEQRALFRHILLASVPFALYALLTLSWRAIGMLAIFFLCAGFYSAEPIRAKARPFLDSIFSAGHYVATGLFSYVLIADILRNSISWPVLLVCMIAGMCWAISMHAYSAVPDIAADSEAGLRTIATKLGKRWTLVLCAILYGLAGILAFPFLHVVGLILGAVYIFFMLKSLPTTDDELFTLYTYFPRINSLFGMLVFFTILLR